MNKNLDDIRQTMLRRIEQNEINYKLMFVGAAVIEAIFLAAFLLLADFSDRLHLLVLISSMTVYTILGFGLIALGLHVNRNVLRIINAIELIGESKN